jgi:hypothetical protein
VNSTLLRNDFVKIITGERRGWLKSDWTAYESEDILTRLMVWKAPLFQLLFQFPRPPLGLVIEAFSMVHLMGDPIDTLGGLLYTLFLCRRRAQLLRKRRDLKRTHWKALALIMMSYDECGVPQEAARMETRYGLLFSAEQ